jgi:two-component system sensor histidine kinase KdpD
MMRGDVGLTPIKILCGFYGRGIKRGRGFTVRGLDADDDEAHLSAMENVQYPASRGTLLAYAQVPLLVAISTALGMFLAPRWGTSAVDLLYLPAVLAVAATAGLGPAIFAAVASALAYNFFFTAPYHTLRVHSPSDVVTVVVLFLVALVTSQLAAGIRKQAQIAKGHAARNATIAGLARRLLTGASEHAIAEIGVAELAALYGCNALLVAGQPRPSVLAAFPPTNQLTPSDVACAASVLASGTPAGRGLQPATPIEWQFHPIQSETHTIAAVGLARDDGAPAVDQDHLALLRSLLDQIALALDRARLEREARDFAALRERDRMRATLLSSIGEDLNRPLAAIASGISQLRRDGSCDRQIVSKIGAEATRVQRYLANLLELEPATDHKPLEIGGIRIDLFNRSISRDGREIRLTPKEYALLAELAKHAGRVLTHAHLLKTVWGPAQEAQTEYLRVAVRALRQKLELDPGHPEIIINEPAVGYRLVAAEAPPMHVTA